MINSLVSIVLPVYNAEAYLDRCLQSILGQTYTDIQIIVLDDGSKDKSVSIIQKYLKDERITFVQKSNSGPSDTRNIGIQNAEGEYITFVDADDWLEPDYISTLVSMMESMTSDLVVTSYIEHSVTYPAGIEIQQIPKEGKYSKEQFMPNLFKGTMGVLWSKLFRTDIILYNGIKMNMDIRFQEDLLFLFSYINHCHNINCINAYTYHYNRLNENNLTARLNSEHLADFKKVQQQLLSIAETESIRSMIVDRNKPFYQQYILQSASTNFKEFSNRISKIELEKVTGIYRGGKKMHYLFFLLLKNKAKSAAYNYLKILHIIKRFKL